MTDSGGGEAAKLTPEQERDRARADLDGRVAAIVELSSRDEVERLTRLILGETEESGAQQFAVSGALDVWLGESSIEAGVRAGGDANLVWLSGGERPEWIAIVPVSSPEAYITSRGAVSGGDGVASWRRGEEQLWVSEEVVAFEVNQRRDTASHVAVSNSLAGARHGGWLVRKYIKAPGGHLHGWVWPSRLGVQTRWTQEAQALSERLAASGHGLEPPRAAVVNYQLNLYRLLGRTGVIPEPVRIAANYRLKEGKPRELALELGVAAPETHPLLHRLYEALHAEKARRPIRPRETGEGTLVVRLRRDELSDLLEQLLPLSWRMTLASRGESAMTATYATLKALLEYNRGTMTLAFGEQRIPLSGEVYVAWEGSEMGELQQPFTVWVTALIEKVWAPMFLADTRTLNQREVALGEGLRATEVTFETVAPKGNARARLGCCWVIRDAYMHSYYGYEPCEGLKRFMGEPADELPSGLELTTTLTHLLDLLYAPYGEAMQGDYTSGGAAVPVKLALEPEEIEGRRELVLRTRLLDGEALKVLARNKAELTAMWRPSSTVDLSDLFERIGFEQAIYQEPALMSLGSPGLFGGMPPAYFLGLPFSLPPAPPVQLREAVLSEPAP